MNFVDDLSRITLQTRPSFPDIILSRGESGHTHDMSPLHDTPILGMAVRPPVSVTTEYGNAASFWVEYPNGLVDLTRSHHISSNIPNSNQEPPEITSEQLEIDVDTGRKIRIDKKSTAIVIIDMQK
jgi:hypothetical protein